MKPFTVSFFGHRKIDEFGIIEENLSRIMTDVIKKNESVVFLIGRQGEFDEYAASVIKGVKKRYDTYDCSLVLVLPYTVADIEYYSKYYDDIVISESADSAHPKAAAELKNRYMIDASDLVVFYVREKGGAYKALQYAVSRGKKIVNIADENK